jgi:Lrp/AsnC family transcriptional regulator, regulator for asnA, asnC and gidA
MIEALDSAIIKELQKNSRQTNVQIAKKLKVSEATVRQRITKLVDSKIIQNFTVNLSMKTGFSALVLAQSNPQIETKLVVSKLKKIKDIQDVYETTGNFDIVINVSTGSAEEFNFIIEKIRTTKGIQKTDTLVLLKMT